jgi:hypothetical protein
MEPETLKELAEQVAVEMAVKKAVQLTRLLAP